MRHPKKYGFIISNPPYGERLEEKSALPELYTQIGQSYAGLDSWSMYLITSYENTERDIGKKAAKNRKIYNGIDSFKLIAAVLVVLLHTIYEICH